MAAPPVALIDRIEEAIRDETEDTAIFGLAFVLGTLLSERPLRALAIQLVIEQAMAIGRPSK